MAAANRGKELFNALQAINSKAPIPFVPEKVSGYILMMWLAHSGECIDVVNRFNKYLFHLPRNIEDEKYTDASITFKYLKMIIPKNNRRWLKWVKGTKKKKPPTKKETKLLEETMTTYNLSKREAKQLIEVIKSVEGNS